MTASLLVQRSCPARDPSSAALAHRPASIAAGGGAQQPAQQHLCPWDTRHSAFQSAADVLDFGRGRTACVDAVIYGYDLLFEQRRMWAKTKWLGVPMQQDPNDAHILQEVLWRIKPDVLIELGTNTGGGALYFASLMHLMGTKGKVITIDPRDFHQPWIKGAGCWTKADKCPKADENRYWEERVTFIQGLPTDEAIVAQVEGLLKKWGAKTVMVSEDSSHGYHPVIDNINAYARFVTPGSYLLVQDTKGTRFHKGRACANHTSAADLDACWRHAKLGPLDAVRDFLEEHGEEFEQDREPEFLLYTQHAGGFLKRVK